jgi:hypothetical protein
VCVGRLVRPSQIEPSFWSIMCAHNDTHIDREKKDRERLNALRMKRDDGE